MRTALEAAHREIDTLKRQVVVTTDIRDGKAYHVQQEEVPVEGDNIEDSEKNTQPLSASTTKAHASEPRVIDDEPTSATPRARRKLKTTTTTHGSKTQRVVNIDEVRVIERQTRGSKSLTPNVQIVTQPSSSKHGRQMASKIDVKIRLSSDIKVNGSSSETGSDSNSGE